MPTSRRAHLAVSHVGFTHKSTLIGRTPGIELLQIVQTMSTSPRVRLSPVAGAALEPAWPAVRNEITRLLAEHKRAHTMVE